MHVTGYSVDEHVAIFWREDDGGYRWYLGVVNELCETDQEMVVSYYIRGNKTVTSWNYPEEAEIRRTNVGQVLARKLNVSYHCYAIIRCSTTIEKAKEIDEQLAFVTGNL